MSSTQSALKDISSKPHDNKLALYNSLISKSIQSKNISSIIEIIDYLINKETEQYSRTYITPEGLQHCIKELADEEGKNSDPIDLEELTPLLKKIVELIRTKADDYPDALLLSLDLLAKCYQAEGEYKQAAYALGSFKFDDYRGKSQLATVEKRVEWHVSTAEFWLAVQEIGSAAQQIKRAHAFVNEVKNNPKLQLRFRTVYARVLDNERKFLEAALRYMELSQNSAGLISEADILQTLEFAVTCAILAKAGPSRARVLVMLYSDERSKQLNNYSMLEAMFRQKIIKPQEVSKFEKMLAEHQKADTASGRTVLQNSIIEHNIVAASKIFNNCKFEQLGGLLGISAKEAESLTATMIEQGRLQASIDQVEGVVEFTGDSSLSSTSNPANNNAAAAINNANDEFHTWDGQIGEVCLVVNRVLESIGAKYPQYSNF
jgi:COP9 signalosome complex subunit 4